MSVVAVKVTKNKITIGADSILVSGWTQEKDKLAKLNKVNGMVIGDVVVLDVFDASVVFCVRAK